MDSIQFLRWPVVGPHLNRSYCAGRKFGTEALVTAAGLAGSIFLVPMPVPRLHDYLLCMLSSLRARNEVRLILKLCTPPGADDHYLAG